MTADSEPKVAKDLSHFLSEEAKSRKPSPLKTAFKYFGDPNITFLGGGLPQPELFPFHDLKITASDAPFSNLTELPEKSLTTEIFKHNIEGGHDDIPLATSLQYGFTEGNPRLVKYLKKHTEIIHKPLYKDWDVVCSVGNTQGWDAVLRTFTNRGDYILVEHSTFSSVLEANQAMGVKSVGIPMDDFGIIPEKLEFLLKNWKGNSKPKLLYTIPTGQNPTGSTLSTERRSAIYKLSQKYDFLIIEDEPYYFLQMDDYTPDLNKREENFAKTPTHEEFVSELAKSFLSIDTDGRVIRLDSFSKVLAPGTRLGWFVGQSKFLERIVRLNEVTMQAPCGFGQSAVYGTLSRWGQDGYLDWLIALRKEYSHKRDIAIDAINKYLPKEIGYSLPPTAGMFFTICLDSSKHPKFNNGNTYEIEKLIFESSLKHGSLMIIGSWFDSPKVDFDTGLNNDKNTTIFFRGTYAAVGASKLVIGIEKFCEALKDEFNL